jgi:uncharacterized membrane protein
MLIHSTYSITTALASFAASLVECTEALTIVLAVGVTRGWRSALTGTLCGTVVLALMIVACGPLLAQQLIPISILQLIIGVLLLLFGLRWLRKAILRSAHVIPLHDETMAYQKQIVQMGSPNKIAAFDVMAFSASFKVVFIEGIEVVFIVIAMSTTQASLISAVTGAVAALLLVTLLGLVVHRPLTKIPENSLKFGVAVILSAFGLFWIGEGSGHPWPGGDLAIPALIVTTLIISLLMVRLIRLTSRNHA